MCNLNKMFTAKMILDGQLRSTKSARSTTSIFPRGDTSWRVLWRPRGAVT